MALSFLAEMCVCVYCFAIRLHHTYCGVCAQYLEVPGRCGEKKKSKKKLSADSWVWQCYMASVWQYRCCWAVHACLQLLHVVL